MARISGSIPDDGRVIIVNESDRVVEYSTEHSTGNYDAEGLTEGPKMVLFRRADGFTEGYSNVDTVASLDTANILSFGYNDYGQLGLGNLIDKSVPTSIGLDLDWKKVSCGTNHTFAIKDDGTLWGWGGNNSGQLGIGNYTARISTPTQIGTDSNWLNVACGNLFTVAIKTDGTIWSCGTNGAGQLGQNNIIPLTTLTKIGVATDWANAYCGTSHVLAIKSTGTLWSWGYNSYGQLGFNNRVDKSVPTQIGADTNWVRGDCGSLHSLAIKTTGTAWSCGRNTSGILGQGDTVHRSTFTQIGLGVNWHSVALGDLHTIMLRTDNTIWACGMNFEYQLGMGDITARSVPTQIGTDVSWIKVDSGQYHSIALKNDGTAWSWAASNNGQLGLGNTDYASTPTRIGTEEGWLSVSCGDYSSVLVKEHPFIGDSVGFSHSTTTNKSMVLDSNANKTVLSYKDHGDIGRGKTIIGNVLGDTINFNAWTTPGPVMFNNGDTYFISSIFDPNTNKVIISYQDYYNSSIGKSIVGTVSGSNITFGTAVTFNNGNTTDILTFLDPNANKVLVFYKDTVDSSKGKVKVGTVSGDSISFGSAITFSGSYLSLTSAIFDSSTNKVVIAYTEEGDGYKGNVRVGTVSGDSISFGSPVIFSNTRAYRISSTFDSYANRMVISYRDYGDSNKEKVVVGTVSGDSISFGSPVIFSNTSIDYVSLSFDSNVNKITSSYQDTSDSNKGKIRVGVITGDSISFGSPVIFNTGSTYHICSVFDSNSNKLVIAFTDPNYGSSWGKALVALPYFD